MENKATELELPVNLAHARMHLAFWRAQNPIGEQQCGSQELWCWRSFKFPAVTKCHCAEWESAGDNRNVFFSHSGNQRSKVKGWFLLRPLSSVCMVADSTSFHLIFPTSCPHSISSSCQTAVMQGQSPPQRPLIPFELNCLFKDPASK